MAPLNGPYTATGFHTSREKGQKHKKNHSVETGNRRSPWCSSQ